MRLFVERIVRKKQNFGVSSDFFFLQSPNLSKYRLRLLSVTHILRESALPVCVDAS